MVYFRDTVDLTPSVEIVREPPYKSLGHPLFDSKNITTSLFPCGCPGDKYK